VSATCSWCKQFVSLLLDNLPSPYHELVTETEQWARAIRRAFLQLRLVRKSIMSMSGMTDVGIGNLLLPHPEG
jgi:hypothetical protein